MLLFFLIIIACVLADQLTKSLALKYLAPISTVPLIRDVLHLTYVENTGAAFGMLKDHRWVFMALSTVAVLAIIGYAVVARPKSTLVRVSLALVAAGGVGNMIDRVARGFVVDFIDFRAINFYVFNGADSFVTVGSALLILAVILSDIADSRAKKKSIIKQPPADTVGANKGGGADDNASENGGSDDNANGNAE